MTRSQLHYADRVETFEDTDLLVVLGMLASELGERDAMQAAIREAIEHRAPGFVPLDLEALLSTRSAAHRFVRALESVEGRVAALGPVIPVEHLRTLGIPDVEFTGDLPARYCLDAIARLRRLVG